MGKKGKLVILSGPSGAGKSTVVKRLLKTCPLPLELSVSATTRPPRRDETHGVQYWFLTHDEFQQRREQGDFLESFEVFGRGIWYGTLKEPVTTGLNSGKWVLLEIDVNGAKSVLDHFPEAITIFLRPESMVELERRLRGRKSEDESAIQRRMETAVREMESEGNYRHLVINREIADAVDEICRILFSYRD